MIVFFLLVIFLFVNFPFVDFLVVLLFGFVVLGKNCTGSALAKFTLMSMSCGCRVPALLRADTELLVAAKFLAPVLRLAGSATIRDQLAPGAVVKNGSRWVF